MEYGEKIEKCGKRDTHTIDYRIGQETMKNVKNEKCPLQDLEYGKKTDKRGK